MSRMPIAGAFLLASALAGCSGPIGGVDYPGDPQLKIRGQVTSTQPLDQTEVVILVWQQALPPSMASMVIDGRAGDGPVTDLERAFEVWIYDPPRSLEPLRQGEVALARGNLAAIPLGWIGDINPPMAAQERGFGADVGHWIVYLDGPAEAGTLTAWWLGAPDGLRAGYHLVRVEPFCIAGAERAACVEEVLGTDAVPDAATAEEYCDAPYRLSPDPSAPVEVQIGAFAVPPPAGCPPP